MDPQTPHTKPASLFDEADDEDLILACASCGCSSCLYYFDVDDGARGPRASQRYPERPGPRPRRPMLARFPRW